MANDQFWDVIIVGAGPAGLSAALLLGRCRRRVLVCDSGTPRNGRSLALHGFLTRDGIDPWELRQTGREELRRYDVGWRETQALDARLVRGSGTEGGPLFEVDLATGERVTGRRLLLATGVRDSVPPHPGFDACFGRTVHHCPYCDGWEARDLALAVYGRGRTGIGLSLALLDWSGDVLLCTDGPVRLTADDRRRLERYRVRLRTEPLEGLEHQDGRLTRVMFRGGPPEPRDRLFLSVPQAPQCGLAARLGCHLNTKGTVVTGRHQESGVPGLYVAGDASHDVQLAIVAASEGAKAAFAINTSFQRERLGDGRG